MARKSKFESNRETLSPVKWRASAYIRLSRDDGDREESDSVSNQRSLLCDFISTKPDIELFDVYIDDGWSGTNFDRPAFTRMMQDVKKRDVNCVIVKDLSRFGRNYIEVGQYIEKVFPLMDIRFISVNDSLDSYQNPSAMNNLVVPFKNIINDEYCRDISNKVRSSLDLKRRQGKFIGSFAAYGYIKDPQDHNRLVVDAEAADVVRDIFMSFISGMSLVGIAKKLNAHGYPNPTLYRMLCGQKRVSTATDKKDGLWCDTTIRRILTNPVYIGTLAQGKNRVKSYKLQVQTPVPRENWILTENAHEPIIERELFDTVQGLLCRDTRTAPSKTEVYLFSGFVKCADCGRAMNRKLIRQPYADYCYFICSTFKKMNSVACTKHTIRSDRLEAAVTLTIQKQIELAVAMDEMIAEISARSSVKSDSPKLERALKDRREERLRVEAMKLDLYPDLKSGIIDADEYAALKLQFDSRLKQLDETIENLQRAANQARENACGNNAYLQNFIRHKNLMKLTRPVLAELVDDIFVHEGGAITIAFKFSDEYRRALEFIEQNKNRPVTA